MPKARHKVTIARPDFYVFGAASLADLPALVDDLLAQLGVREVATA